MLSRKPGRKVPACSSSVFLRDEQADQVADLFGVDAELEPAVRRGGQMVNGVERQFQLLVLDILFGDVADKQGGGVIPLAVANGVVIVEVLG